MRWRPLLIAGVALAMARPAQAQRAEADAAFQRGRALMARGAVAQACAEFETSMRLDPVNGTLYNLGLCHEQLGKLATAWSELRELAERDSNAARAKDAARRVAELEPRLTRMRVRAQLPPAGLVVQRDGLDVTAFVSKDPPVDPGRYTFEASAPGYLTATFEVELVGEGQTVEVLIPELVVDAAAPSPTGASSGYPSELALRPLILPRQQLEVTAFGVGGFSSRFDSSPVDVAVRARYSLGVVELDAGIASHVLYARDTQRPDLLSELRLGAIYAVRPMLIAGLGYVRHHPTQGAGQGDTGSDLLLFGARKLLLTPRLAVVGRGGFSFSEREGADELALATEGSVQAIGTSRIALEAVAQLGLNVGGRLYDHTVDLDLISRMLVAMGPYDLFLAATTQLLPDASYQAVTVGASWRLR